MKFSEWWATREESLSTLSREAVAEAAFEAALREAIHIANGVKKHADGVLKRSAYDEHANGQSYGADAIARRIHEALK